MADFNRKFNKPTELQATEAQPTDTEGWNGDLNLDTPEYTIKYIHLEDLGEKVNIKIDFEAQQGSITQAHSRVYYLDIAAAHPAVKAQFKTLYDWVVNNVVKVIPDLNDGIEQ